MINHAKGCTGILHVRYFQKLTSVIGIGFEDHEKRSGGGWLQALFQSGLLRITVLEAWQEE